MRVYRWNGMMSVICFQIPQEAKMYSDASGKEPACQCRRHKSLGFNPWVGKLPWKTGNPLQYSCLGNPTARGTWWATVHRVAKSQTWLKQLRKKQEKMLWKEMKQIGKALVITDDKCYELSFTHSKSLCWGSKTPVSLNLFGNGVVADVIS